MSTCLAQPNEYQLIADWNCARKQDGKVPTDGSKPAEERRTWNIWLPFG